MIPTQFDFRKIKSNPNSNLINHQEQKVKIYHQTHKQKTSDMSYKKHFNTLTVFPVIIVIIQKYFSGQVERRRSRMFRVLWLQLPSRPALTLKNVLEMLREVYQCVWMCVCVCVCACAGEASSGGL